MDAIIPALVGAVAGAIGSLLVALSSAGWEDRRTRRALLVERYREGRELLDQLVELAGRRHFALQRWLWALQNPANYDLAAVRADYFDLLPIWNERTWRYRANLRLLLGDQTAARYLDYADDSRSHPMSLHYMFVSAHNIVRHCEQHPEDAAEAQAEVDHLNHAWSAFADYVTERLLERAGSLRLLEVPLD